jgi:hypothetical protein
MVSSTLILSGLIVLADKGYHGADGHVLTPYRGRNKLAVQKEANRAHAQLKSWQILRKLRCCPGASGSWPRPSMSFKPARSQDEKGSVGVLRQLSSLFVNEDGPFPVFPTMIGLFTVLVPFQLSRRSVSEPDAFEDLPH